MIENIKVKEHESLKGEIRTMEFGKTNIIIGPKGGGKSTLFDLLANAPQGQILSSTIDALQKYNLELYSITIDGEEIPANTLTENKVKINKGEYSSEVYKDRNDVIYQDDDIKKNLSNSNVLDKKKMNFSKEIAEEETEVSEFINKIKHLYDSVMKVKLLDDKNINWSNTFNMNNITKKVDEQLIFKLNYSSQEITFRNKQDIYKLENESENFKSQISLLRRFLNEYKDEFKTNISQEYKDRINKEYTILIKKFEEVFKLIKTEITRLNKIISITTKFETAYAKEVSKIKRTSEESEKMNKRLASYESDSSNHFKEMAKRIKDAKNAFEDIILNNITIDVDKKEDAEDMLSLEIKGQIAFTEDEKYKLIMKALHNAKKVQTNVANWIMSAREKQAKPWNTNTLINEISRKIKLEVKIMANNQNYETMSLGERSIYGIKHKFSNAIGKPMFLDQPEDNLDNYTIAKDILSLINNKEEQLFIVTHNANIGILSNPDKVIVGEFDELDAATSPLYQYNEGTLIESESPSDTAHYLEGGIQYIKDRLEIIKGGN